MSERYDVIYDGDNISIDHHFCREWDDDGGCYGTRKDHGMSWEDARKTVEDHYSALAERWRTMTFAQWRS